MDVVEYHAAASQLHRIYTFGCYRLDTRVGLSCNGRSIQLAPKELGVLTALLERGGAIASKDDLLREVWPRELIGDESLTRCIYVLRQTLREGLDDPIATVHRRGYRFAVPVRQVAVAPDRSRVRHRSVLTTGAAHAAYLEGRQQARRGTAESLQTAIVLYEEALRVDSNYVVALISIAECRIHQCVRRLIRPMDAATLIREACASALSIDPLLPSAHAALGWVQGAIEWQHQVALRSLDFAVELDTEYATSRQLRAWILRGLGQHEAAIADLRAACQLDPYVYIQQISLIWSLFLGHRHREAMSLATSAARSYPSSGTAHAYECCIAAFLGELATARAAAERLHALAHEDCTLLTAPAYCLAVSGETVAARAILNRIEQQPTPAVPSLLLPAYVALGDERQVEQCLMQAANEHCAWLMSALHDPRLKSCKARIEALVGTPRGITGRDLHAA